MATMARDSIQSQVGDILAEALGTEDPTPEQEPTGEAAPEPVEAEAEEEAEATAEPETEEEQEEQEEVTFKGRSLRDVAEAFGVDVSDLYDVQIPVSEGVEPISLGQLKDTYQEAQRVKSRQKDLETKRTEFDAWRATQEKELRDQNTAAVGVLQHMYGKLTEEFNKVNWDELRRDDPAEWAARQNEFQTRNAELQQMYATLQAQSAQRDQQLKQEQERQREVYLAENRKLLLERIEDWRDSKVAEVERGGIVKMLTDDYGFQPSEFANIADARVVHMLRDLLKLKGAKGKVPDVLKAARNLPKMRKPGTATGKAPKPDLSRLEKAAKAGDQKAQLAMVSNLLRG